MIGFYFRECSNSQGFSFTPNLITFFNKLTPNVARRDGRYSFWRKKEYPENPPGLRRLKVGVGPSIDISMTPSPRTRLRTMKQRCASKGLRGLNACEPDFQALAKKLISLN